MTDNNFENSNRNEFYKELRKMIKKDKLRAVNTACGVVWRKSEAESILSGRPNRDTIINNEDIINLRIALGSYKSLREFLSML